MPPPVRRRDRLRAQTLAELRQVAGRRLDEGGPEAVALNAIAREMGLSGPALYRYVAGRGELLAELAAEGYEGLADALERTAGELRDRPPVEVLRAIAAAYRAWGLANPRRYELMFARREGSGALLRDRVVPAAQRSMEVVLDALARLPGAAPAPAPGLAEELAAWRARAPGPPLPPGVLHRGVVLWARLHGLVSLEVSGALASMGLDGGLLVAAEVDALAGGA